jgi:hypothetical protein
MEVRVGRIMVRFPYRVRDLMKTLLKQRTWQLFRIPITILPIILFCSSCFTGPDIPLRNDILIYYNADIRKAVKSGNPLNCEPDEVEFE